MHFNHIQKKLDYKPNDIYPYAPPQGKEALRLVWKEKLLVDNPSMNGKSIGTPIVTSALTHGLSIAADLFMDAGDVLVTPQQYWGNYNTVFQVRRGGRVETFLFSMRLVVSMWKRSVTHLLNKRKKQSSC